MNKHPVALMLLQLVGNTVALVASFAVGGTRGFLIAVALTVLFGQPFGKSRSLVKWMRERSRIRQSKEPS